MQIKPLNNPIDAILGTTAAAWEIDAAPAEPGPYPRVIAMGCSSADLQSQRKVVMQREDVVQGALRSARLGGWVARK